MLHGVNIALISVTVKKMTLRRSTFALLACKWRHGSILDLNHYADNEPVKTSINRLKSFHNFFFKWLIWYSDEILVVLDSRKLQLFVMLSLIWRTEDLPLSKQMFPRALHACVITGNWLDSIKRTKGSTSPASTHGRRTFSERKKKSAQKSIFLKNFHFLNKA